MASVTLIAFGRRGYAYAAANMVASLRHFGFGGDINLWCDDRCQAVMPAWASRMCSIRDLPKEWGTDPGYIKIRLPRLIEGESLYLDVDGIAVSDITPWLDALRRDGRDYITCVQGRGNDGDRINNFPWATTAKVKQMEAMAEDATYYGIQSSWCFIRNSPLTRSMSVIMEESYDRWTLSDLKNRWGGTKPDELFYSIACTHLIHDPTWEGEPMFWGKGFDSLKQIKENHHIISLWGMGRGKGAVPPRHVDKYDAVMKSVMQQIGEPYRTHAHHVQNHKHANTTSHVM